MKTSQLTLSTYQDDAKTLHEEKKRGLTFCPLFYCKFIKNLFDYLEEGEAADEFLADFPSVRKEQVVKLLKIPI